MSAKIRHLALYTEHQDEMANFYQNVFGMKRITRSFNDPNKGHISDGVIGLAVLKRRPSFAAGFEQFWFEGGDVEKVFDRKKKKNTKNMGTKRVEKKGVVGFRDHHPPRGRGANSLTKKTQREER